VAADQPANMTGGEMMTSRRLAIVAAVACSIGGMAASATNLKPIEPLTLQNTVAATARELLLPGAMVLLRTPQGTFAFGVGATELGGTTPPRADTSFRIASNTKTMTAAVIVQLVQEGKLRFDDRVSHYVQGIPNGDDITIRQLLKMRSGLSNYTSEPELAQSLDRDSTRVWTAEELLALAFKHPPAFAPGTEYDYCNTNYLLLGLIAEKLEGKPLVRIFQDRLFRPLGMKATLLPASTSNAIPEPYTHGYLYGSSSYALVDAPYPADLIAAAEAGTLKPNDDTHQNPSYAFAAGGVISTADDLATWMRALVGGKVLDAAYQRQWLDSPEPQDPGAPESQQYGYGISLMTFGPNRVYFHGGEMPGYNSFMGYDPVNDVTLIIWTSLTVSLDGQPTANTLMLKLLAQIYTVSPFQHRQ
jgi:D-alanyl-D-alanine carboxypeptidase